MAVDGVLMGSVRYIATRTHTAALVSIIPVTMLTCVYTENAHVSEGFELGASIGLVCERGYREEGRDKKERSEDGRQSWQVLHCCRYERGAERTEDDLKSVQS